MDLRDKVIARESAKKGFKSKVYAKCAECIYDPGAAGEGTWRQQVENCTDKKCPLYSVRPTTTNRLEVVKP